MTSLHLFSLWQMSLLFTDTVPLSFQALRRTARSWLLKARLHLLACFSPTQWEQKWCTSLPGGSI